jgi:hypothetical protein
MAGQARLVQGVREMRDDRLVGDALGQVQQGDTVE